MNDQRERIDAMTAAGVVETTGMGRYGCRESEEGEGEEFPRSRGKSRIVPGTKVLL